MKRYLVIGDGPDARFHPLAPIEPLLCAIYPDDEITVDIDYPALRLASLKAYDLIINYADMWGYRDTAPFSAALEAHIRAGGRMLLLHGGLILHGEESLASLYGATFTGHPPQCPITYRASAPFVGVEPFQLEEEPYRFQFDETVKKTIVLNYEQDAEVYPAGWCMTHGEGRILYLSFGHSAKTFEHPSVQVLMRQAAQWCLA